MKQIHISITKTAYKKLKDLRIKHELPSISRVIEHLVMENAIGQRIDPMLKALERIHIHKGDIPDEPKVVPEYTPPPAYNNKTMTKFLKTVEDKKVPF